MFFLNDKKKSTFKARHDDSSLQSQLLGRWRWGGLWFQGQLGQKVSETSPSQPISWDGDIRGHRQEDHGLKLAPCKNHKTLLEK
jgi:hypothetical protein